SSRTTANAGAPFTALQSLMASRNTARTHSEASMSMAARVDTIEKPVRVQTAARYAITPGGCALGVTERGTSAPEWNMSRAAGTNWPTSSQKNGRSKNAACETKTTAAKNMTN